MNLKNLIVIIALTVFLSLQMRTSIGADCCARTDAPLVGEQLWCFNHSRETCRRIIALGFCACECDCGSAAKDDIKNDAVLVSSEEEALGEPDYIPKPGMFCKYPRNRKKHDN